MADDPAGDQRAVHALDCLSEGWANSEYFYKQALNGYKLETPCHRSYDGEVLTRHQRRKRVAGLV
jgi:hypothetical protein